MCRKKKDWALSCILFTSASDVHLNKDTIETLISFFSAVRLTHQCPDLSSGLSGEE